MQADNNNTVQLGTLFESANFEGLFFAGGGRKKAVDSLVHFARYGSMLLFLRGDTGSGRSTVLREFANSVDRETRVLLLRDMSGNVIDFLADEVDRLAVEVGKLIEQVAAFDADANDPKDEVEPSVHSGEVENPSARLSRYVKRIGARGRRLVVAFDDQLALDDADLATLIKVAEQNDGIFKLVFSGDQALADRVGELSERQTVLINFIDLPEFSTKDAMDYIAYRLQAAGYDNLRPFKAAQVETALRHSGGDINRLHAVLSDVPLPPAKRVQKPALPLPHLIIAGMLLLVIGAIWFFSGSDQTPLQDEAPIVLERINNEQPVNSEGGESDVADNGSRDDEFVSDVREEADSEGIVDIQPEKTASAVIAAASAEHSERNVGEAVAVSSAEADKQPESPEEVPAAVIAGDASDGEKSQATKSNAALAVQAAKDGAGNGSAELIEAANSGDGDGAQRQVESSSVATGAAAVHKRLLNWPETGYALQVFGTHNARRAEQMVEDYFAKADLVYYETRHNDKPWFVVVTGPYTGSEAARNGIAELPDGLRGLRPWPRNIASIHRDIRRYHSD